jgi:hypothetical protein
VEDMMTLGILRLMNPKEDELVGTMTGCNKKVEVCRYIPTERGPLKMILVKPMNTVGDPIIMVIPFIAQVLPLFSMPK